MDEDNEEGLFRLQRASELLLASALNCPIGARPCDNGNDRGLHSFTDVAELYQRYKRLKQLVHQKTVQLEAEKVLKDQPVQSTDELITSISVLEEELLRVSTDKMLQSQLIQKLQLGAALDTVLFPEDTCTSDYQREIRELLKHHAHLTAEIREELKECSTLSHQLDKSKKKNLDKVEIGRRLKRGLDEIRNARQNMCNSRISSETVKKYKEDIQTSIKQIILIRNIFQGLIIGSGIDWAADQELTDTLLGLGDSVDNQIASYIETDTE